LTENYRSKKLKPEKKGIRISWCMKGQSRPSSIILTSVDMSAP